MRDEELDLIAALAAGDLDPAAASEAEALLARGGAYREEYVAQLRAASVLGDMGSARMTELERARMRRAVMADIAPEPRLQAPRSLRWLRPLAVAAAAVVIVGFGGLWLTNSGRSADLATQEISAFDGDSSILTSTTVTSTEAAAPTGADTEDEAGDFVSERATSNLGAVEGGAMPLDLGAVNSRDIDEQYLTDIYLGVAQFTSDDPGSLGDLVLTCAAAAEELSKEPLLAFGVAEYDGQPAQYFGFVSRRLVFLDAVDCSLLGEHP